MNTHGITEKTLQLIITTCLNFSKINHIILYGSRARGDYIQGSDIDIAIDAPEMSSHEFSQLWNALDDLPIIYSLDVVHLQSLTNKTLLEAIHQGIILK